MRPVPLSDIARLGQLRFGDRVALEDASGAVRITYRDLWTRVQSGAGALRAMGLAPRDRVLLMMDGHPDWIVSFLSIVHADLVAVPIPGRAPAAVAIAAAASAGVRACVCDSASRALAGPDSRLIVAAVASSRRGSTSAALRPTAAAPLSSRPDFELRLPSVLVFTSGSSSTPRAVALTHDNLLANLRSLLSDRPAPER